MSEDLDKVTNSYKECLYFSYSLISNQWLNFALFESKAKKINQKCIDMSLELQECVVECKTGLDWSTQKECWKKCTSEE